MKKTQDEIKGEITRLREMQPSVRHHTMFGDDNWEAIETQIEVLEKGMDEDAIYHEWPEEEDARLRDVAQEAMAWMEGEGDDEPPSLGWQSLVKKKE